MRDKDMKTYTVMIIGDKGTYETAAEGRVIKEAEENFSVMVPQERFEDKEELLRILKEFVPLMARLRGYDGGSAELVSWYVQGTDEEAYHA